MEPTIVYKKGGHHRGPKGSFYDYKGVSDEETLKRLLKAGYCKTIEEAIYGKAKVRRKTKTETEAPKEVNELD